MKKKLIFVISIPLFIFMLTLLLFISFRLKHVIYYNAEASSYTALKKENKVPCEILCMIPNKAKNISINYSTSKKSIYLEFDITLLELEEFLNIHKCNLQKYDSKKIVLFSMPRFRFDKNFYYYRGNDFMFGNNILEIVYTTPRCQIYSLGDY